jgi:hypothetical protein
LIATIGSTRNLPPIVVAAHTKLRPRHRFTQLLQVWQDVSSRFTGENNIEFLAPATVSLPSSCDTPQVGRD